MDIKALAMQAADAAMAVAGKFDGVSPEITERVWEVIFERLTRDPLVTTATSAK